MCSPGPNADPPPDIVELNEHTRVINIPAGPAEPVAKEVLPELVHAFGSQLDAAMAGYDLIHSHYWLSGMVGVQLRRRHGIPLVHTMHTMARVKNAPGGTATWSNPTTGSGARRPSSPRPTR